MQPNIQAQLQQYKQQHHRLTIMVRKLEEEKKDLMKELERVPQLEKDIKLLDKELKELKKASKGSDK